ncbi:hypothetical protein ACMC56_13095 [Campylobacterota bacterium DY0563]|nr:hypothetical protein [Halarcobacter ebronensis]
MKNEKAMVINKEEIKNTEKELLQIVVPLAFGWELTTTNAPTINCCTSCH